VRFPFSRLQVQGSSMLPTFSPKQNLISFNWAYFFSQPKKGEVVMVKQSGKLIVKRISKVKDGNLFLVGDNPEKSTDSRQFGWVEKNQLVGKVIFKYN